MRSRDKSYNNLLDAQVQLQVQELFQEIMDMKTFVEEQVQQNREQIIKLRREIVKNEEEVVLNQTYLKTELSALEDRVVTLKRGTITGTGVGDSELDDDISYEDEDWVSTFTKKYLPFTRNNRSEENGQEYTFGFDHKSSSSASDPYNFWSRGPVTLLSLSYAFRLSFGICFAFISFDRDLMYDGTSTSYRVIEKPLCSTFLLLSVIFSFQAYRKRGIISLVGWIIILAGAIAFIISNDYFFCVKTFVIIPNLRIAFGLLAAGHLVELIHTLIHALRLKRILVILKAVFPPCFAIAAYILPLTLNFRVGYGFALQGILLVFHGLAQYVAFLYITPETPDGRNTEDEKQANMEPEPLPDDMLDTFTLMMTSNDARVWNFGFLVFNIQAGLSLMIIAEQFAMKETAVPLDAPSRIVSFMVVFSQFSALLLAIFCQTDILTSVQMLGMLWYGKNENWPYASIYAKNGKLWTWIDKVLLPNILRLFSGLLVLATSFVIIVKSDNVIDLFKDFTALILISDIDNIAFRLANHWYFGDKAKTESDKVKEIHLVDDSKTRFLWIPIRLFLLLLVFGSMVVCWSYFIDGQVSGKFYLLSEGLTNCTVSNPINIGDGHCNNVEKYNTEDCLWDGGDCKLYNQLENCTVMRAWFIQDGRCDGGDYNTVECNYDGGDCTEFNENYPNCNVDSPYKVGDNFCDKGNYDTEECGYDGGDCDDDDDDGNDDGDTGNEGDILAVDDEECLNGDSGDGCD